MISFCPLCDAKIRLPMDYEPETHCSCPVCHGSFQIAEILQSDAPEVLVLDVDPAADDAVMSQLDDTIEADQFLDAELQADEPGSADPYDVDELPWTEEPQQTDAPLQTSDLDDKLDTQEDDHDFEELLRNADERATDDELESLFAGSDQLDQEVAEDELFSHRFSDESPHEEHGATDFELEDLDADSLQDDDDDDPLNSADDAPPDEQTDRHSALRHESLFTSLEEDQAAAANDPLASSGSSPSTAPAEPSASSTTGESGTSSPNLSSQISETSESSETSQTSDWTEVLEPSDTTQELSESESTIKPVPAFHFRPSGQEDKKGVLNRARTGSSKNPFKEVAKIVLGGVAGLVVAQLIIWWLPEDWRRDPIGLAPKLPEALAFLAPAELRDANGLAQSDSTGGPAPADSDGSDNGGGSDETSDGTATPGASEDNDLARSFQQAQDNATNGQNTMSDNQDDVADLRDGDDDVNSDLELPSGSRSGDSSADLELTGSADANALQPVDMPEYSERELAQALVDAQNATENLRQLISDPNQRRGAAQQFSQAMATLAATMSATHEAQAADTLDSARSFLRQLASDNMMTRLLGLAAESRMRSADEGGIVIPGRVQRLSSVGSLREIQLEVITGSQPVVTVVTVANGGPSDQPLTEGDTIVVCGRIVDSPLTSLRGYTGQATRVIWTRHAVPVTAPQYAEDA